MTYRRTMAISAYFSFGLLGLGAANAATTFEVRVFVTAVTPQCTGVIYVGNSFTSVFRPKLATTDPAEGLSIVYPSAASVLISTAASGRLVNSPGVLTNFQGTLVGYNAAPSTWTSTARLSKVPATVTAATPAVTISGTINHFNASGCTITIRGAYARRP